MHNNKISSQPKKANHHDRFFKRWYSDPAFARELLQLVLTQKEQQAYDLSKLKPEKDTLPEGKQADLVFSMPLKDEPQIKLKTFILLEHKSKYDPKLFTQLLYYQTLLHKQSMRDIGHACPIVPVVFYHGHAPWRGPKTFQEACFGEDLTKTLPSLKEYMVNYKIKLLSTHQPHVRGVFKDKRFKSRGALYLLSEIWRLMASGISLKDIEELLRKLGGVREELILSAIRYVRAAAGVSQQMLKRIEQEAIRKGLLTKGGIMDVREDLREELREEMREELGEALRQEVREEFMQQAMQQGMQQAMQQGRREKEQAVILNMLKEKADIAFISKVTGLPEQEIKKFKNGSGS